MFRAARGFLFSRRIKPMLKAASPAPAVIQEEDYVGISDFDFEKRDALSRVIKKAQEELLYKEDNAYSTKLVDRVNKGAVWGLGGQLIQLQKKANE